MLSFSGTIATFFGTGSLIGLEQYTLHSSYCELEVGAEVVSLPRASESRVSIRPGLLPP